MHRTCRLFFAILCLISSHVSAESLPKVTGLVLDGDQLSWDAQEGADGYNIHLDYQYFDTVRGTTSYMLTEPGDYHVISFNDAGVYGVSRSPDEVGQPYTHVKYQRSDNDSLPKITGLVLDGNQLSWDAQAGADGYNIHLDYEYFDTVRGTTSYTLTEPGNYHVISFNDAGVYGVSRSPDEFGQPYDHVEYSVAQTPTYLPKITGLALEGNELSWDAQEAADGYNIHRNYEYFDTVRGATTYTLTEPGDYHVISFNDAGVYGISRNPGEAELPFSYVEYNGCIESIDDPSCLPVFNLSDLDYFKEVALKVEFGNTSQRIKKWRKNIEYFVSGTRSAQLSAELDRVIAELNELMDVQIVEAASKDQANFQIFFGIGDEYAKTIQPGASELVQTNIGLAWLYWGGNYEIIRGTMLVDNVRTSNLQLQKHIVREELTQAMGILNDAYSDPESIFYGAYSRTTEFAPIDREVVETLYSPHITTGMTSDDLDRLFGLR